MENQPPFTANASAWLNRKPAAPEEDESELNRLRERLSFYESFDSLIQENVSRASELLRHAATMRENSEEELARTRREVEEARLGDRQEYRSLLSGLLDEVTTMQVQIERLARRVSDALDDLETGLPAGAPVGRIAASSSSAVADHDGEPAQPGPALSLDPTPEEVGPPEPEGEAEFRGLVPPEVDKVEADAVLAEAAETPLLSGDPLPEAVEPSLETSTVTGNGADSQAAAQAEIEVQPDGAGVAEASSDLIVDEIVMPPADEDSAESVDGDEAPAGSLDQEKPATQAEAGDDGVISDTDTGEDAYTAGVDAAPPAPAADEPGTEPEREPAAADTAAARPVSSRLPWIGSEARPFSMEGIGGGVRRPATGELRTPEPSPRPEPSSTPSPTGPGIATAVLVHGVPRATTALSLKRFLEGLPHVGAVEPREYAEGILRLHVTGERSLQIDDLRGWSDGSGLEPVHVRDDLIEVRLPS